mmetsp:Transcript_27613/g.38376  ORF Transcript_27613/g.38376 Transcript_27613/m.38376 type:complete len:214 (-) Transcript_27613:35-676(-)
MYVCSKVKTTSSGALNKPPSARLVMLVVFFSFRYSPLTSCLICSIKASTRETRSKYSFDASCMARETFCITSSFSDSAADLRRLAGSMSVRPSWERSVLDSGSNSLVLRDLNWVWRLSVKAGERAGSHSSSSNPVSRRLNVDLSRCMGMSACACCSSLLMSSGSLSLSKTSSIPTSNHSVLRLRSMASSPIAAISFSVQYFSGRAPIRARMAS